ncbi:MAG: complex I NDUFA9 subunit family protein [Nitrospinae bacterium]|nr:complex I NDUFA9 subunit family protein [Nitrospinota bacterium]
MKIFIAGGTGFVGAAMVNHLAARGHELVLLARTPAAVDAPRGVRVVPGDVFNPNLAGFMSGCDAAINLIGIIRAFPARGITFEKLHVDATRAMVDAAKKAGVRRYLQMSANSVRPDGISEYQRTKSRAEAYVKASGLDWTIFRPSLIFGDPGGKNEFCKQLFLNFRPAPVIPMFGDGNYRLQPVHVDDVARAFGGALEKPETAGRIFHIGGDVTYSYREILNMIFLGAGKPPRPKLPVPWFLARPFVALLGRFPAFPATAEQIDMLLEGNTIPENEFKKVFGIAPIPLTVENLAYLKKYA